MMKNKFKKIFLFLEMIVFLGIIFLLSNSNIKAQTAQKVNNLDEFFSTTDFNIHSVTITKDSIVIIEKVIDPYLIINNFNQPSIETLVKTVYAIRNNQITLISKYSGYIKKIPETEQFIWAKEAIFYNGYQK